MAKKKQRKSHKRGNANPASVVRRDNGQDRYLLSQSLREGQDRRRRLTRDYLQITNPVPDTRLSLAEDLRDNNPFNYDSQGRKFRNVDGTIASTTYKQEPVKKKVISFLQLGVMSTLLFLLIRLLFVDVDINVAKYFSLIKFW